MKVRGTAHCIVAASMIAAGCGGGATSGSGAGNGDARPPESGIVTTAAPGEDGSNDGPSSAPSGTSRPAETTATSRPGDTTGTSEPGAATAPSADASDVGGQSIESPLPDPSEMTPIDDPPDHTWMLLRGYATVTAGGGTVDFFGTDPLWLTDFNPAGKSLLKLWEDEKDVDPPPVFFTIAGCSVLQTGDGLVIAQASFHHSTERNLHSSFSMSDNGDGTVTWGLYNAESGEEWSATGPGEASVRYARFENPYGWERFGIEPGSDDIYILIDFEGMASENFTTAQSQASSRVLCHYVQRPT